MTVADLIEQLQNLPSEQKQLEIRVCNTLENGNGYTIESLFKDPIEEYIFIGIEY